MRVLGIDPGTATTGFGVVEVNGAGVEVVDWGLIETGKDGAPEARLTEIHEKLMEVLSKFNPAVLAIERVFFATNAKTAISVGQAMGVMMLSAGMRRIPVVQYAPGTIKKLIAGDGRADKTLIKQAVRRILGAKVRSGVHKKTHFDNAADALAVAICHSRMHLGVAGGEKG